VDGRAAELIRFLGLEPHPEGGHFLEVFRSERTLRPPGGHGPRSAATHIYFLLASGERSRWHRLGADEVWHFYEGSPLDLYTIAPAASRVEHRRLGPLEAAFPTFAVPARTWQAARPTGAYTLAGCTVAPGFEYADFELLALSPAELGRLRAAGAELGDLL
jgi:predicted cupin superfamily sugar epimerase